VRPVVRTIAAVDTTEQRPTAIAPIFTLKGGRSDIAPRGSAWADDDVGNGSKTGPAGCSLHGLRDQARAVRLADLEFLDLTPA
jgi:hypothetical protein